MIRLSAFAIVWISLVAGGSTSKVSILTIENHEFGDHIADDGWGEWSEWQNCSRSCGGGVTYMRRECLRDRSGEPRTGGCVGSDKMYSSCSIQDCPVNSEDFRSQQCAERNSVTYYGRTYEWIPYTGESAANPCELYCQPKSKEFFLKVADKVVDGTKCRSGSLDVCVDGTCEPVGCDMLLGSNLTLDRCGECGGNGSSCYPVKSSVNAKLPSGYMPLIFIPPGATNIHVYERKGSRNFLAVRDSSKKYVLNGQWQVNSSSVIHVAGSDLIYTRKQNKKRAPEHIRIVGPITEMIYIDVLVQDRNRGIEYEFYLPRGMSDPNRGEHEWFAEQWNTCSKECGRGLQKRRVFCKNNNGERVLKYLCSAHQRPPQTRECNEQPCEKRWHAGQWSACTQTCGGGVQTRRINCIEMPDKITGSPLLLFDDQCQHLLPRPETQRRCGTDDCRQWTVGAWSACSTTCGLGVQVRAVTCPASAGCNSASVPPRERSCNLGPCSGIEWVATEWGECVGSCGEGVQTRQVNCAGRDQISYPDIMCDIMRRPPLIRDCYLDKLCPEGPNWLTEEWSQCSVTCGIGVQTRRVVCAVLEIGIYRKVPDRDCQVESSVTKPSKTQGCKLSNCTANWYSGPWGPCSVTCQGGRRRRAVMCLSVDNNFISADSCRSQPKPISEEVCNRISCRTSGDVQPLGVPGNCHLSTYGCCPDGVTAASGPFQTSCGRPTCRNSLYGCCPDEQHFASGDNYEGCPNTTGHQTAQQIVPEEVIPERQSAERIIPGVIPTSLDLPLRCRRTVNPGTCVDWTVYWFFDTRTGRCDRFWFGGCHGNENRFETKEECARVCAGRNVGYREQTIENLPRPAAAVFTTQPPKTRTTTAATIKTDRSNTFFSPEFDIDGITVSGGLPKAGNTASKKTEHPPPVCFLRKSSGPCGDKIQRWYFDGSTGNCNSFWYGGCGGNENNFANQKYCAQICGNKVLPGFDDGLGEDISPPVAVSIKPGRTEVFAQAGKVARLACMAEGRPKPTVTWHRLEKELQSQDGRMEILEDNSLIISKITQGDAGSYECVASNGKGPDQTWTVKLIVKDRVLIRETPTDITIPSGATAALRCRIQDDVLFVTWYKDGEKVQSDEYYNVQPWGDLHILQAETQDSGEYTCTAYAQDAVQHASAILTVVEEGVKVTDKANSATALGYPAIAQAERQTDKSSVLNNRQCRDYPEYANCNIVVLKRMCHKHDYARYCCASCGGSAPLASRRHSVRPHRRRR